MKYYLENPSFTKSRVEIDNEKAINQIQSHLNKQPNPVILGDAIILSVDMVPIVLQLIKKNNDEAVFVQTFINRR